MIDFTAIQDHANMSEDGDDARSSDRDTYTTTESERGTPEPDFQMPYLSEILAPEIRSAIIEEDLRGTQRVVLVPTAMTRGDDYIEPLATPLETLRFTTTRPLARTCKELASDYTAILQKKVFNCEVRELVVNVLDFDFSFITTELLSKFSAEARQHYNSRRCAIYIDLTITDHVECPTNERGLQVWLDWRAQEEAAGRNVAVRYAVAQGPKGLDELESVRYFLEMFNPYGTAEGDMKELTATMITYFEAVYAERKAAGDDNDTESEENDADDEEEEDEEEEDEDGDDEDEDADEDVGGKSGEDDDADGEDGEYED